MGWAAAAEMGVALERVAVVRSDERRAAQVLAALVDAFDLVVIGDEHRPDRGEIRRLQSRARERGAVLLRLARSEQGRSREQSSREHSDDGWGADVRLECGPPMWSGPGQGWGHLQARRTTVTARGRRGFDRPHRVDLWLPGPDGVAIVEPAEQSRQSGLAGQSNGGRSRSAVAVTGVGADVVAIAGRRVG